MTNFEDEPLYWVRTEPDHMSQFWKDHIKDLTDPEYAEAFFEAVKTSKRLMDSVKRAEEETGPGLTKADLREAMRGQQPGPRGFEKVKRIEGVRFKLPETLTKGSESHAPGLTALDWDTDLAETKNSAESISGPSVRFGESTPEELAELREIRTKMTDEQFNSLEWETRHQLDTGHHAFHYSHLYRNSVCNVCWKNP